MYSLLLTLHIAAGTTVLLAAAAALVTSKGAQRHIYAGRTFVLGMLGVFLTAVPMTFIRPNLFLFLIAVFSFYLASTGWLRATNRTGIPTFADWIAASVMTWTALAMCVVGIAGLRRGNAMGIVLVAFGAIGGIFALTDLYFLREKHYRGNFRIAAHLTRMLAGTIGAVTAFTVVNVRFEPEVIKWLAPTVVTMPLIVFWNIRVLRTTGFPVAKNDRGASDAA